MHKKGSFMGLTSGFFWGLDSVVLGVALGFPAMMALGINSSLITTFMHDSFSFIILMFLIFKLSKFDELKKTLKSKAGLTIFAAALLGGPIGMGGYIMAIKYLGSTLASSISAIYPAAGLVLAFIFLKERMRTHSIIGLFVAIGAIVLMGISSDIEVKNLGLGLVFVAMSIIGWGSEAVIINAALKEDVSSEVALAIRQLTSSITYALVVIPLVGYSSISVTLDNPMILVLVLASGFLGTLSYLAYYKAIDIIGATQAMGLNISYPAWAFVFQYFIDREFSVYMFVLAIIIMIGSIMSNDKPKEVLEIFKIKKA